MSTPGTKARRSALSFASASALVVLLGLLPLAASASSSAAFSVRGSNGFRLDVESAGERLTLVASERRPPVATFSRAGVPRPAGASNGAASIYRLRARRSDPGRIEVGLGRLGRIAVDFQPSGRTRVTRLGPRDGALGCGRSVKIVRRLGTFVGVVEFKGEGGYTSVRVGRAPGSVGTPLPSGCAGASRSPRGAALTAVDHRSGTRFEARTTKAGAAFLATWRERLGGGVVVSRRAYAGAPRGAFGFDEDLTSARVRPPAPFTGSARYLGGAADAGRWQGSLRATFPGAAIPLTGAGFRAGLVATR
ncbi:MAG TPA: hypothetical protein VJU14_05010 [Solirubrobacterales bacterium]|nr:hypothetical protein [Solirubrobacterales bacterium]